MSLYDLPKDMLIKIVTTIEEDTKKKLEDEMFTLILKSKILDKVTEIIGNGKCEIMGYCICNINKCKNYGIYNDRFLFYTEKMFFCRNCDKSYCRKHNTTFTKPNPGEFCDECLQIMLDSNQALLDIYFN